MKIVEKIDYSFPPTSEEAKRVTEWLALGGYRVIRPLVKRTAYCEDTPPNKLVRVAILDTETTGLDIEKDRIIELGMLIVEVCPDTGIAYRIIKTFDELEDPGFSIPSESVSVHGITDDMVKGKRIDDAEVAALISGVDLVIAHNAGFDRPFVERRFDCLTSRPWACSLQQIPWRQEGIGSASQEYLAYRFGFHYVGHRASNDCEALLEVLQQRLPGSGQLAMLTLLVNSKADQIQISALDSPFESKEVLKTRGYRWESSRKVWFRSVTAEGLPEEASWLRANVYGAKAFRLEQEDMNAMNRFSSRPGTRKVATYK